MKKLLFTIVMGLLISNLNAQKLEPTSHVWVAGTADNFKGGYTFAYTSSGTPWNGSLISYGGFDANNYDTQISSDYGHNRISFRTKNGDTNTWNTWNEFATKGSNDFIGNQSISANLGISILNPQAGLDIFRSYDISITKAIKVRYEGSWGTAQYASNYRFIDIQSSEEGNILAVSAYGMGLGYNPPSYLSPDKLYINGNVGIGTTKPDSKLTVAGNIHAQEVKVTINAGVVPDYVFANDYKLKSLQEVEYYVKQNSHLPEIPSASEIEKNGLMLAEMNLSLLKKIEELTLYMIEMKKEIELLKNKKN